MKIAVAGAGYVGLSLSILLSKKNEVCIFDIDQNKVNNINSRNSPINDALVKEYLLDENINLFATVDEKYAYTNAKFLIIAVPTDYDEKSNQFNTKVVEKIIKNAIQINQDISIIIKSTVPLGFTNKIKKKYRYDDILFSPEFLREDKSITDNLYPSRIIIGATSKHAMIFSELLSEISLNKKNNIMFMSSDEAESVKLFSNTYLAMRIAFFNELDGFSEINNLDTQKIIEGVSADKRIGNYYNNPSFGYGGYCLPKDTKQLLANYDKVPNNLIQAIVEANKTRKDFIAKNIISKKPKIVGIYRLVMKKNSKNFRDSAVQSIIIKLIEANIKVIIYEPILNKKIFLKSQIIKSIEEFKSKSDLIISNRNSKELDDVKNKVYSRDIFEKD